MFSKARLVNSVDINLPHKSTAGYAYFFFDFKRPVNQTTYISSIILHKLTSFNTFADSKSGDWRREKRIRGVL